ncbi:MAG: methyltransferase domain-containing protein [Candidatus Omnitrophica bacterium]|nr:methyltransferase domain-containing protein [Candidatus Omnitrophota bacterium]
MSVKVLCNLCGANHYTVVYGTLHKEQGRPGQNSYKITDHSVDLSVSIVKCCKCGLIYMNPQADEVSIHENYSTMSDDFYFEQEEGRRRSADSILKYLKKIGKTGRILDVGCAAGFLLDQARRWGWEVYGVELSSWAVDYAKNTLHLPNVTQGTLKEARYPANFFDAVILKDVIEHLTDPKETLEQIRHILKPSGIICCNTPDIDSSASKILGAKWWGIKQSHLFYFNKNSLSALFKATGFFPFKIRSHARTFTLYYWVTNLIIYKPAFGFIRHLLDQWPALANKLFCVDLGDQIEIFARKSRQLKYLHELESVTETDAPRPTMKVCVVLPAYNAASTLKRTLADIPPGVDEIILVDDASRDNTADLARSLGLKVFVHDKNTGYGGNQKTCYKNALASGSDIVVMLHPDYQYDPTAITQLIEPIKAGRAEAVFGSRMMKGGALEGGMPLWKHNANILLTALENVILGIYLTEYHSGFRAYSAKFLRSVNFESNSDGFVFDTEIIVQGVVKYMKIEEVPIRTRYFDEASSIKLWPSILYGLNILKTLFKFVLYKSGVKFKQFD